MTLLYLAKQIGVDPKRGSASRSTASRWWNLGALETSAQSTSALWLFWLIPRVNQDIIFSFVEAPPGGIEDAPDVWRPAVTWHSTPSFSTLPIYVTAVLHKEVNIEYFERLRALASASRGSQPSGRPSHDPKAIWRQKSTRSRFG